MALYRCWGSGEGGGGEPLDGDAEEANVLDGKTFYSNSDVKKTGTMPNIGEVNETLHPGESYTIQEGYYSGGDIQSPAISSQSKGVWPSDSLQIITPDDGYDYLSSVTVYSASVEERTIPHDVHKQTEDVVITPSDNYVGMSKVTIKGVKAQSKTVTPSATNQVITPDLSYDTLTSVTVEGDSDLIPSNIKSGVNIFGVTGNYALTTQSKSVNPSIDIQTVVPDSGYDGLSSVTVYGMMLEERTIPRTIHNDTNDTVIVTDSGYDGMSKITIKGVKAQSKTVTPSASSQTVTPDLSYNTLTSVTVEGDSDLIPSNIKSGVNIFGVTGTYTGGGGTTPTGNATESDVLSGKTFSNSSGTGKTGTMTDRTGWSTTGTAGQKSYIPKGYHDGNGYVDCPPNSGSIITETTLWTNSSPSSNLAAGNVSLSQSLANFTYIKVYYKEYTGSSEETATIMSVTDFNKTLNAPTNAPRLVMMYKRSTLVYYRWVYKTSNTQVYISAARQHGTESTNGNGNVIVTKIAGILVS